MNIYYGIASEHVPSDTDIVDTRTKLHATVMGAASHGMIDRTTPKAEQGEDHEQAFWGIYVTGRMEVEKGYRMYAPEKEGY